MAHSFDVSEAADMRDFQLAAITWQEHASKTANK